MVSVESAPSVLMEMLSRLPSNRAQDRAPMSTPRKRRNEVDTESFPPRWAPQQDGNGQLI